MKNLSLSVCAFEELKDIQFIIIDYSVSGTVGSLIVDNYNDDKKLSISEVHRLTQNVPFKEILQVVNNLVDGKDLKCAVDAINNYKPLF